MATDIFDSFQLGTLMLTNRVVMAPNDKKSRKLKILVSTLILNVLTQKIFIRNTPDYTNYAIYHYEEAAV